MKFAVVTVFPELVEAVAGFGVVRRAMESGIATLEVVNPRDFTEDRHRTVDDRPYGGGPGMLMKAGPLCRALEAARGRLAATAAPRVIYLSPQGRHLDHAAVLRLSAEPALVLLAGRYEGIDERVVDRYVDEELSIGDFVLSGGELGAMVVIDAIVRQLPGSLGHEASAEEDSFADGLLDCPHYTRPERFAGQAVPAVLLSGDHGRIRRWRLKQSLGRTLERRPELLEARALTAEERLLLEEYCRERGRAMPEVATAQDQRSTGE